MIYVIGEQKIKITKAETKEDKGTPNQIVPWRDVAATCRTLDAVCRCIDMDHNPAIVDGIARAGFWGAVFRNIWPECFLHLNEKEENCLEVLKRNFPEDIITDFDISDWTPKECDITLLDFDRFTLRIIDKWVDVLKAWEKTCTKFIIADGACFGFKFGNMKHYGITAEEDYYYLLDDYLKKILNKRITVVSKFTNAATILLEKTKKPGKIKFVPPSSDLFLNKGDVVKGLFF
jgi:hypothetical protein